VLSRSQRGLDHREPVDLATITAHTLEGVDTGGPTVERSLAPALTDGAPRLIERLAANLLTNAVHHNQPTGRIDVTTRATEDHAILRVTNSGPAISPDDLDRLFEPFQRIDGTRTSAGTGLGLGLSIVKAVADAHAATITTTLPEHGGLSIEIAFPAPRRTQTPPPVRHEADMANSASAPGAPRGLSATDGSCPGRRPSALRPDRAAGID
jgi:signal transduction histidine kinase